MLLSAKDSQPGCIWQDATSYLKEVCDDMKPGELLHGEDFSLFDSMSAVEIGDRKMDAGMEVAGMPTTVGELVKLGKAPLELSPDQLLDVMDQLLACEATWHDGHTVAQTIYTCLYMHELERTKKNEVLWVYCRAVWGLAQVARALSIKANIHAEEDFFAHTFGFDLNGHQEPGGKAPAERCVSEVNKLEEKLARLLKLAKEGGERPEGLEPLQADPAQEAPLLEAVLPRLRAHRLLLQAMVAMDKPGGRGLGDAQKRLGQLTEQLDLLEASMQETPRSGEVPGFDQMVNRKLLAPAPPRAVALLSPPRALAEVRRLAGHLSHLCSITEVTSLSELELYLREFGASRPGAVARARLAVLLFPGGHISEEHPEAGALAWAPLRPMVREAVGMPTPAAGSPAAKVFDKFLDRAVELTLTGLRIECANISRQRRKMRHALSDWAGAYRAAAEAQQSEAVMAHWQGCTSNAELQFGPQAMARWAYEGSARCMAAHLTAGFDLELYHPREFCMVYWYLDYTWGLLLQAISNKANWVVSRQREAAAAADAAGDGGKKGKKGKGKDKKDKGKGGGDKNQPAPPPELLHEHYIVEGKRLLCQGVIRLVRGLTMMGKLSNPELPFNGEEQRFEQRFGPLQVLERPQPLVYAQYRTAMATRDLGAMDLLKMSLQCFARAREGAQALRQEAGVRPDVLAEAKAIERAAATNIVALQVAVRPDTGNDGTTLGFGFPAHPHFAVLQIQKPAGEGAAGAGGAGGGGGDGGAK